MAVVSPTGAVTGPMRQWRNPRAMRQTCLVASAAKRDPGEMMLRNAKPSTLVFGHGEMEAHVSCYITSTWPQPVATAHETLLLVRENIHNPGPLPSEH